jgi:uncharacterized delta-60 repeat protein
MAKFHVFQLRMVLAAFLVLTVLFCGLALSPLAYAPTLSLEKTWGGTDQDWGFGVAVDGSGNIYVAGMMTGDVVLLKYDSAGGLVWQKTWGGTGNDYGFGVAVDGSGNIYVTGYTESFGAGNADVVLLKYSPSGGLLWQKTWGGTNSDEGWGVAVDSSGNIYVAGYTYSFGAGNYDVVLLKYDSAGGLVWQKTWGGGSGDFGWGVAVDGSGNIYVTGGTLSFGAGSYDVVLLKFDSSGGLVWQNTWGDTNEDSGRGVAVDGSGNIYVTGYTMSFGAGYMDVVLLKFDSGGTLQWQRTWGGISVDCGEGVAVDDSGNIYVTGYTDSFGAGGYDVVLLKYDSAGGLVWQKTWGGTDADEGWGVTTHAGYVYFTGYVSEASRTLNAVSGNVTTPSGTVGSLGNSTLGTPTYTPGTPIFTPGTPSGSETYAGSIDVFLLKFSEPAILAFAATELLYDDGSAEGWGACGLGYYLAVRFSLPSGWSDASLLKVRYYIWDYPRTFKVHVFGSDGVVDLLTPFAVTPNATGWFDLDLTSHNVRVSGDFYVAAECTINLRPYFGRDTSSPDNRSYTGSPGTWTLRTDDDLMIRAVVEPSLGNLVDFTDSPTGNVLMIIGDIAINPHGSKPSGVGYQQGRDTTPLGYLRGMVNNTQPSMFDTNAAVNATSGRPLSSVPQTLIFAIGGPDINGVTHYYEHTDVTADRAPVTWSEEGSNVIWRLRNGTVVVNVTQASTNVPPGTSDVFAIQVLFDADGGFVVLMYGERYTGTWAAAEYFKFIVYPTITTWTNSYYIVRWTDATSGTSANMMPDSGDSFTILAQG